MTSLNSRHLGVHEFYVEPIAKVFGMKFHRQTVSRFDENDNCRGICAHDHRKRGTILPHKSAASSSVGNSHLTDVSKDVGRCINSLELAGSPGRPGLSAIFTDDLANDGPVLAFDEEIAGR